MHEGILELRHSRVQHKTSHVLAAVCIHVDIEARH